MIKILTLYRYGVTIKHVGKRFMKAPQLDNDFGGRYAIEGGYIARMVGVFRTTVSRTLNNTGPE